MKRVRFILKEKKTQVLMALAALTIAVLAMVASGAFFTASSTSPGNTFATGTMSIDNSAANTAVFTAEDLFPGDAQSGDVTIGNPNAAGHDGVVNITAALSGQAPQDLDDNLMLQISDTDNGVLYDGKLSEAVSGDPLFTDAIAIAAGDSHDFHFQVYMIDDATNQDALQTQSTSVDFTWTLESTPHFATEADVQ